MDRNRAINAIRSSLLGCALAICSASCAVHTEAPIVATGAGAEAVSVATGRYIVQSASVEQAAAAVEAVGGVVTHELGIIRAASDLTPGLCVARRRTGLNRTTVAAPFARRKREPAPRS